MLSTQLVRMAIMVCHMFRFAYNIQICAYFAELRLPTAAPHWILAVTSQAQSHQLPSFVMFCLRARQFSLPKHHVQSSLYNVVALLLSHIHSLNRAAHLAGPFYNRFRLCPQWPNNRLMRFVHPRRAHSKLYGHRPNPKCFRASRMAQTAWGEVPQHLDRILILRCRV